MHENHRRMFAARAGAGESPTEANVAIREPDILTLLDCDSTCHARRSAVALPRQRGDHSPSIALEVDSRLDRFGDSDSMPSEELVVVGWIQYPNLAGFIECDKLSRLIKTAEFIPQLEIYESVRSPLIHAGVLAKNGLVNRANLLRPEGQAHSRSREEGRGHNRSGAGQIAHRYPPA